MKLKTAQHRIIVYCHSQQLSACLEVGVEHMGKHYAALSGIDQQAYHTQVFELTRQQREFDFINQVDRTRSSSAVSLSSETAVGLQNSWSNS